MPACRRRCRHIDLHSAPGGPSSDAPTWTARLPAVPTPSATCRGHWHAPCNSFAGEGEINDYRAGDGWSFPVGGDAADRRHVSRGPTPRTPHYARRRATRDRGERVGRALAGAAPFRASPPICRSFGSLPILRRREPGARRVLLAAGDAGGVCTFPTSAAARTFTAAGAVALGLGTCPTQSFVTERPDRMTSAAPMAGGRRGLSADLIGMKSTVIR